MESRFAHLRQRDTSVSMLRVKMSRRRSQSQKENRDRAVNTRRQLEKLAELEMSSLDASVVNMSTIHEKTVSKTTAAKNEALEERMKQLQRWKERKALEKEKEKREKARKGVFKTGLYHPKDTLVIVSLPEVAATKTKETKVTSQPTRVTRSMKQQQVQKPLRTRDENSTTKKVAEPAVERSSRSQTVTTKPAPAPAPAKTKTKVSAVEPVVRALSTRSAKRPPVTAAPVAKDKPGDKPAVGRVTRGRAVKAVAPPPDRDAASVQSDVPEEPVEQPCPSSPTPCSMEVDKVENQAPADSAPESKPTETAPSFAPKDFVFQAPTGLSTFRFEPLTPRSADAFLTPSISFSLPPVPLFNVEPEAAPKEPSPSKPPCSSPPPPVRHTPPTAVPLAPCSPVETKHDVPYFRLEISNETERLTNLCTLWESKVEDESIPEEMRDRMRTAVGQARLLMKERFKQFSGLVDDCELGRGEKITTCTDLQGFWDMVYFQVEDVDRKFAALKEAESRSWVDDFKPPPRQKKLVKKPAAASTKPKAEAKAAAAKSRLAAVKAAMKAKQQAAMAETQPEAEAQPAQPALLHGGLGQAESPAKPTGSLRRSSRLSAAVQPQASPCASLLSPRRVTRRSLALAQTPVASTNSPAPAVHTPVQLHLSLCETPAAKPQRGTPRAASSRKDNASLSVCCSPVSEVLRETQAGTGPGLSAPLPSPPSLSPPCLTPSVSPCKTPLPLCQAPEPPSCLSFTLSPCVTTSESPLSSPPAEQHPAEAPESPCHTPDSSVVEEIPGLDFERYLQPTQRCSLSPQVSVALETLSPMALDVEMESPRGHCDDLLSPHAADSPLRLTTALPAASPVLAPQSPQVKEAESALLLFTPDLKDRIRQSVCPTDLMVFTPPL